MAGGLVSFAMTIGIVVCAITGFGVARFSGTLISAESGGSGSLTGDLELGFGAGSV